MTVIFSCTSTATVRQVESLDRGKERSHGNVKALRGSSSSFHRSRQSAALQRRDELPRGALLVNCSDCGSSLPTDATIRSPDVDTRVHTCACGQRFMSEQRIMRRLTPVPAKAVPAGIRPPLIGTGPPQVVASTPADGRGVGGVLPEGSSLVSISPSSKPLTQTRVEPASADPRYPNEFENMWRETGRRGLKDAAHRAWVKQGKPAAIEVVAAWKSYLLSLEEWRSPKDLSGWINLKGHKQEWVPVKKPTADTRCHFHRSPGTLGKRPPAGWFAACSECKHAKAGTFRREGEPSSIADLAAETEKRLAAQRNVTPATPEQLAELRKKAQ